jgi:hypothetical protein
MRIFLGAGGLGLQGFLNVVPLNGGLGLRARAALMFVPVNDDRRHLGAATSDGLRKRSAGTAAEMFLCYGHWNES